LGWLGYTIKDGAIGDQILVEEHLLQHTVLVRPADPQSFDHDRCFGSRLGRGSLVRLYIPAHIWTLLERSRFEFVEPEGGYSGTKGSAVLEKCSGTAERAGNYYSLGQHGYGF
jgi:hypothetical protein